MDPFALKFYILIQYNIGTVLATVLFDIVINDFDAKKSVCRSRVLVTT